MTRTGTTARTGSVRRLPMRTALGVAGVAIVAAALAACTALGSADAPDPSRSPGALGAGFVDPSAPPAPESTIDPRPGSWDGTHPPAGYDVVLLTPGVHGASDDAETRTLVSAVERWAQDERVDLERIDATAPDTMLAAVTKAIDARPDLVISVGHDMVDPIAAMSPAALRQQFLVLGAEIAEPTSNVTAADWTGAGFRGEGLGTSSHHDPDTFTTERAGRALRAGVAAVLGDVRGVVVWVD